MNCRRCPHRCLPDLAFRAGQSLRREFTEQGSIHAGESPELVDIMLYKHVCDGRGIWIGGEERIADTVELPQP